MAGGLAACVSWLNVKKTAWSSGRHEDHFCQWEGRFRSFNDHVHVSLCYVVLHDEGLFCLTANLGLYESSRWHFGEYFVNQSNEEA